MAAELALPGEDPVAPFDEKQSLTLPSHCPTVSRTLLEPPSAIAGRPSTAESAIHALDSHSVEPTHARPELSAVPSPDPPTVMLADPVEPAFPNRSPLAADPSVVTVAVTLPSCIPAVTATGRQPAHPCASWHSTAVSEAHALASMLLPANAPRPEAPVSPSAMPTTVTLLDPEAAPLRGTALDTAGELSDMATVVLCSAFPEVTATRIEPPSPAPALPSTVVSECHQLPSHVVPRTRPTEDVNRHPKPAPARSSVADPVDGWFSLPAPLAAASSHDITTVALPCSTPAVSTAPRVPPIAGAKLLRTAESETQSLASQPLAPSPATTELAARPRPCPHSVTLTDPVVARLGLGDRLTRAMSVDKSCVLLPASTPAEMDTRCDVAHIWLLAHWTAESEAQPVHSAREFPARTDAVSHAGERLPPKRTRGSDPVLAAFRRLDELIKTASKLQSCVPDPAF